MAGGRAAALAALSALLLASALEPAGAQVACSEAANRSDMAVIRSPRDLQAALMPRVSAGMNALCVQRGLLLDSLSFVPQMAVETDLTLCGQRRSTTLTALDGVRLATVRGARLSVCSLIFDLSVPDFGPAARLEEMLFELEAGGTVRYTNVGFYIPPGPFLALRRALELLGPANDTSERFSLTDKRIDLGSVRLGGAEFEDVEVFLDDAGFALPGDREHVEAATVNSTRDVAKVRRGRSDQDRPLRLYFLRDLKISNCLLLHVHGTTGPIAVNRPVTLAPGGDADFRRLEFEMDIPRGFMDVASQLRVDGMEIVNAAVRLQLERKGNETSVCHLSDPGCIEEKADLADVYPRLHRGAFKHDARSNACLIVARDAVLVHGCPFVQNIGSLLLYHRNNIQSQTSLMQALNDTLQLYEFESISNKTIVFRRFIAMGMCFQNVTMTCKPPSGAELPDPRCRMFENTESTDPEVTTELSEDRYYLEEDTSFHEGAGGYYDEPTSEQDTDAGSDGSKSSSARVTGIALVSGGIALWLVTMGLFSYWYKSYRRQGKKDSTDLGATQKDGEPEREGEAKEGCDGTPGGEVVAPASGGHSQRGTKFIHSTKGKGQGDAVHHELTRESLIGAISTAAVEFEDSPARIHSQIAAGGSGVVYKGVWKGIPVAIKTVVFQDLPEAVNRQRQRAVIEAAISSSIAHKNIVQTYTYSFKQLQVSAIQELECKDSKCASIDSTSIKTTSVVDWKLYIIQEFCDGGTLRDCLDAKRILNKDSGRPELTTIARLALETASGMCHLHSQHNIVHGDLSSKNILLKKDPDDYTDALGTAKIADFGLSIKMGLLQSHISNHRAGTPFYMAPELCQHGRLSKKCDVFSFGVFLWELYHSKKCYHTDPKVGMRYHPLFPKFPIMCPIPYAMLCVVCLSPKPENRPDFNFIARVFTALRKQVDAGLFKDKESLRLRNMEIAAGLGKMTAPSILELIAEEVGITVTGSSTAGCSSSAQDDSYTVPSEVSMDTANSLRLPHSTILPSAQLWMQGNSVADQTKSAELEVHLSQAYVSAPFNCIMNVSVSTEHDADLHKKCSQVEHYDLTWQVEPEGIPEVSKETDSEVPTDVPHHYIGTPAMLTAQACPTSQSLKPLKKLPLNDDGIDQEIKGVRVKDLGSDPVN
eukprot:evm.model.scf_1645.2 EVM.evm.TU.scf_1645.2   scf_1645:26953-31465(-)